LIAAKGFFSHKITGGLISPGAASATDPLIFTGSAFSLQLVVISQLRKNI
jgi:hypothetical protein